MFSQIYLVNCVCCSKRR